MYRQQVHIETFQLGRLSLHGLERQTDDDCHSGTRDWAEPLVERLLGPGTAEVAVFGDDVTALKPAPDAYRLALDRLGVPAADAVAVEDSAPGLGAALAAGLVTVVVTNDYTRDHDLTGASLVRASFGGSAPLTVRVLEELLAAERYARGA